MTSSNIVRKAYENYERARLDDTVDVEQFYSFYARQVWVSVYCMTSDINPSMAEDLKKGNYDKLLLQSDICYLDKNWKVLNQVGVECNQCGEIHHAS